MPSNVETRVDLLGEDGQPEQAMTCPQMNRSTGLRTPEEECQFTKQQVEHRVGVKGADEALPRSKYN